MNSWHTWSRTGAEMSEDLDEATRNARAVAARAESFSGERGFDVVVTRAVGALAAMLAQCERLLAPHGRLLAMKGRVPDDEIRALPRGWMAQVIPLRVPGLEAERH